MSAGLFGLLDDVAAIAKLAAASVDDVGAAAGRATTKAAGVVVDDTAVTPQYVQGIAAERELPIIKQIAVGSIRNKLLIILPLALLLSAVLPDALPIILMVGGTYLAFEGAEKVWERVSHHDDHVGDLPTPSVEHGPDAEKRMVSGAVRTDLILSAEIMVIALNEVSDESFWAQFAILVVVALVITVAVYGVVALIVKMDDAGLALARRSSALAQRVGRGLVAAMPRLLAVIAFVGTIAMLWVGGHILLVNLHESGWWHAPYEHVHDLEHDVAHAVGVLEGPVGWSVNTAISAVIGLVVGAVVVVIAHLLPFGGHDETSGTPAVTG
jgi:predicted DNA repair protein MutK